MLVLCTCEVNNISVEHISRILYLYLYQCSISPKYPDNISATYLQSTQIHQYGISPILYTWMYQCSISAPVQYISNILGYTSVAYFYYPDIPMQLYIFSTPDIPNQYTYLKYTWIYSYAYCISNMPE
jgi:hypothetical protein